MTHVFPLSQIGRKLRPIPPCRRPGYTECWLLGSILCDKPFHNVDCNKYFLLDLTVSLLLLLVIMSG